jgi:hypothetical protein
MTLLGRRFDFDSPDSIIGHDANGVALVKEIRVPCYLAGDEAVNARRFAALVV